MKRTRAVVLSFLVVGCTGLDKHAADTFYPLNNPNTPDIQSETARRIRGDAVSSDPILPEQEDVWPGEPDPVPSLQDVSRSNAHFLEKWNQTRPRLDADLQHQLSDGQGLSEGENVGKRYGSGKAVMPIGRPLPSHVHDNAPPYMEPVSHRVVSIPNGSGTVTLIAPDGSVKVVNESQASSFQKFKTFRHVASPYDDEVVLRPDTHKQGEKRRGKHGHVTLADSNRAGTVSLTAHEGREKVVSKSRVSSSSRRHKTFRHAVSPYDEEAVLRPDTHKQEEKRRGKHGHAILAKRKATAEKKARHHRHYQSIEW